MTGGHAASIVGTGDQRRAGGAEHDDARPAAVGEDSAAARRARARRRRRIDEVFGDVLPTATRDEREPGRRGGFSLEHYRASRPPHWGDKQ